MISPGSRIGEHEVLRSLAQGGMATLFLGRRTGLAGFSKHVAIKVVHPHLATDPAFVEMFLDEAKLSACIDHPNVVHVYELGEVDGSYYLVMEYVHGRSLLALLAALARQNRRLAPEMAVWIAMRVAAGLHAAHELTNDSGDPLGVVHRDVSPHNILLAHKGHVKLIDFGIAKARGRAQQTSAGTLKGKFQYMAPEQAAGHPVDRRTDVYALGVVLWEMLTGRPFNDAREDLAALAFAREPTSEPPRTYVPGLPQPLEECVMQTLAVDPDSRPASADELKRALGEAVPSALSIDAPDLADLMASVLDEEGLADEGQLPESVREGSGAARRVTTGRGQQVLQAFTCVHGADAEAGGAGGAETVVQPEAEAPAAPHTPHGQPEPQQPGSQPASPQPTSPQPASPQPAHGQPAPQQPADRQPGAAQQGAPSPFEGATPTAQPSDRRGLKVAVGIFATLFVAGLLGWIGLRWVSGSGSPPSPDDPPPTTAGAPEPAAEPAADEPAADEPAAGEASAQDSTAQGDEQDTEDDTATSAEPGEAESEPQDEPAAERAERTQQDRERAREARERRRRQRAAARRRAAQRGSNDDPPPGKRPSDVDGVPMVDDLDL